MIVNDAAPKSPAFYSVREWQLWRNSGALVALIAIVESISIAGAALTYPGLSLSGSEIARALILVALCLGYEESARRVEALRFRFSSGPHADMTSVWMVAAAIALQPFMAVVAVLIFRGFMWVSYQRKIGMKTHRLLFTAASMVLASLSIHFVLIEFNLELAQVPSDLHAALAVIVAILTFTLVNRLLVVMAITVASRSFTIEMLIGTWEDNAIEFATLSLGGITAVLLLGHPWLVVLVLAPMIALQRSTLVKQFQEAAMTDSKTGLLSPVAWQQLAIRELARARRENTPAALLMVDLDFFKRVNDAYGHLAGDAVLRSVANALKEELRDYDSVGRFGGEEFVVLLPETDTVRATVVAHRLREAISAATVGHRELSETAPPLTASVGVAVFPAHGIELDQLLRAADAALYRAKSRGRNRVVLWTPESGLGIEQHA